MDYTKTDEQLRNIAQGLYELDPEHNAQLSIRINLENKEIYFTAFGSKNTMLKMVTLAMRQHPEFKSMVISALGALSILDGHNANICSKCDDTTCKARNNKEGEDHEPAL